MGKGNSAHQGDIDMLAGLPRLCRWDERRDDFYWYNGEVAKAPTGLCLHWENQRDAILHNWVGRITGSKGVVKWQHQCMGPGLALETVLSQKL